MEEIWKYIPGYEPSGKDAYYEVSNLGNVRGYTRKSKGTLIGGAVVDGYRCVLLYKSAVRKMCKVHRLVASAFQGLDLDNPLLVVCHKDDNKLNNRNDNLFIGTPNDNVQDCISKGRKVVCIGEGAYQSKISNKQAYDIKVLLSKGVRNCDISRMLQVSYGIIKDIKSGKSWKHIEI